MVYVTKITASTPNWKLHECFIHLVAAHKRYCTFTHICFSGSQESKIIKYHPINGENVEKLIAATINITDHFNTSQLFSFQGISMSSKR